MKNSELRKNYIFKSRDILYRKRNYAKPFYVYIFLSLLNYVPKRYIKFFEKLLKPLKIKCSFYVLDRELKFYINSNLYDFKYHGGYVHELRVSENLLRLTPVNSIFYDVGCSVGWYSILLAAKCKKIIGFDPYDQASLENIRLNKINNFELLSCFLSDHFEAGNIEITTIDELIKNNVPAPDVIKIDVDGEEMKVLSGARNLFINQPPRIVLVETHTEGLFYDSFNFLQSFNYDIYNLGCPKINVGGDIYKMSYNLDTDSFSTNSESRILLSLRP